MSLHFVKLLIVSLHIVQLVGGQFAAPADSPREQEIIRYAKSAEIQNYLNEAYDPCDNFYEFACGNYQQFNQASGSALKTGFFETIAKSLGQKFEMLLQAGDTREDTASDAKAKDFYKSCLVVERLNGVYQRKLHEIVSEFGQMPALQGDQWRESDFDWLQTVAAIGHKYDIHLIVGYFVAVDRTNNSINRMQILPPEIPLRSKLAYIQPEHAMIRDGYTQHIQQHLQQYLGLEMEHARRTAQEIFEFEKHLFTGYYGGAADFGPPQDPRLLYTARNLATIDDMQRKYYPLLDIKRLIQTSLGTLPTHPVYDLIGEHVQNIAFAMGLTPKRIVANYIFYHLLTHFMFSPAQADKQELCLQITKVHFGRLLNNMVYRRFTTKKTEQEVHHMWQTIKTTFQNVFESGELAWMNAATRKSAVEKLATIRMEINSYEATNFAEEFDQLRIGKDDYLENVKSILAQKANKARSGINKPPRSYDDPAVLAFTPFFIQTENLIKIPVALLQPYYLWSDAYPNALKFGTLGFIIAHELIHGFDEQGRTFDQTGNNHVWWDQASNDYFNHQTRCFGAQYHRYIYDGRTFPLLEGQAENTADNGGIRLAYQAYRRWYENAVRSHEAVDSESMPRLNYNGKQLFFITYAQLWCSATNPQLRNFATTIDEHVPEPLRVLVPLANLHEFSREFHCPMGSAMNPVEKCVIY